MAEQAHVAKEMMISQLQFKLAKAVCQFVFPGSGFPGAKGEEICMQGVQPYRETASTSHTSDLFGYHTYKISLTINFRR